MELNNLYTSKKKLIILEGSYKEGQAITLFKF